MDIVRGDQLKAEDWVLVGHPPQYRKLKSVAVVGRGPICDIIKLSFYETGIDIFCNGDKQYEIEKTKPVLLTP